MPRWPPAKSWCKGAESELEQTKGLPPDDEPLDLERTRTSLQPELPDPDEWEGSAEHVQAHFERLARPLRENMAAAQSEELKQGYERAIAELQRKREDALRRYGD